MEHVHDVETDLNLLSLSGRGHLGGRGVDHVDPAAKVSLTNKREREGEREGERERGGERERCVQSDFRVKT
ncbi:MAG: hypothetical protein MJE68_13070 [Proteobacteria bacterium]|nr:hypothetical protein [Pseudomonadota bacterium]